MEHKDNKPYGTTENWKELYEQIIQKYPQESGWICPKCGAVNAPWVSQCPCYQRTYNPPRGVYTCKYQDQNQRWSQSNVDPTNEYSWGCISTPQITYYWNDTNSPGNRDD